MIHSAIIAADNDIMIVWPVREQCPNCGKISSGTFAENKLPVENLSSLKSIERHHVLSGEMDN